MPPSARRAVLDRVAVELQRGCNPSQCERVGKTIADLRLAVIPCRSPPRRKLDRRDDLVRMHVRVEMRRVPGETMKIRERNCALPGPARSHAPWLRARQVRRTVGGIRGNAVRARAENREITIESSERSSRSPATAYCKPSPGRGSSSIACAAKDYHRSTPYFATAPTRRRDRARESSG